MAEKRKRIRESDYMTREAYESALKERALERRIKVEVTQLRKKLAKGRREPQEMAKLADIKSIPANVREIMDKLDKGEDVTAVVPTEFQAKQLPAIAEGYNQNRYLGSRRGRAPKYTPRKLGQKVDAYFNSCDKKDKAPTQSGLMLWLGLARETFYYYLGHPQFGPIMMYARDRIENWLEEKLVTMKTNPTGVIFTLKNRHGWKDVQTVETNHNQLSEQELLARIAALAPELAKALDRTGTIIEGEVTKDE